MIKGLIALVLIVCCLVPPVTAQEDILPLFGAVRPERVTVASAVVGDGYNQREYTGEAAQAIVGLVKRYNGRFTGNDRVQPFTWDFALWEPREYTPLVVMVTAREDWTAWETRNGADVVIEYMHRTAVSCYEVGDPDVYDCRQYQGSIYYEMRYHCNSIQVSRADIEKLIAELGM